MNVFTDYYNRTVAYLPSVVTAIILIVVALIVAAIVRSVVDLARGLGMSVVAEGVEDERTWIALREVGCDVAQGWWLARALPADELVAWLAERDATTRDGLLALP